MCEVPDLIPSTAKKQQAKKPSIWSHFYLLRFLSFFTNFNSYVAVKNVRDCMLVKLYFRKPTLISWPP
jgi:hypothetical protein